MRHFFPFSSAQFFVTAPQPCPYLPDRMERKLFTSLQTEDAEALNDCMSMQGFRRSQNITYRPACTHCSACFSARIRCNDFKFSRSTNRVLKRNHGLVRKANAPWATDEQYDLFRSYLDMRHTDGGMIDMDIFEFSEMIEQTPVRTRVIEYRNETSGDLIAVALSDVLDDGLSMIYSFFNPHYHSRSIGTFMVLDHIKITHQIGKAYLYLGYWIPGCRKMQYKSRFNAFEVFENGNWHDFRGPDAYSDTKSPLQSKPISQQVNELRFLGDPSMPNQVGYNRHKPRN